VSRLTYRREVYKSCTGYFCCGICRAAFEDEAEAQNCRAECSQQVNSPPPKCAHCGFLEVFCGRAEFPAEPPVMPLDLNKAYKAEKIDGLYIVVQKAAWPKCARCWKLHRTVGFCDKHTDLCQRCVAAVEDLNENCVLCGSFH